MFWAGDVFLADSADLYGLYRWAHCKLAACVDSIMQTPSQDWCSVLLFSIGPWRFRNNINLDLWRI